jgi:hypothetical protein
VFTVGHSQVTLLLREVYQHPSQRSVHSFPGAERPADSHEVLPYRREGTQGSDILDRWLPVPWEQEALRQPSESWENVDGSGPSGDDDEPALADPTPTKRQARAGSVQVS